MLIVYNACIRAYGSSDKCDAAHDYLERFQTLSRKDYLIIEVHYNGRVYDPVIDADVYETKKAENYEDLFIAIGQPECFECELQPVPEWIPGEECYQESSNQTRPYIFQGENWIEVLFHA